MQFYIYHFTFFFSSAKKCHFPFKNRQWVGKGRKKNQVIRVKAIIKVEDVSAEFELCQVTIGSQALVGFIDWKQLSFC